MKEFRISPADSTDHEVLTSIAFDSKRYWGYPEDMIDLWRDDLTILPVYIDKNMVFKLVEIETGRTCGFCSLENIQEDEQIEIAHLWLSPSYIGKDLGKFLLTESLEAIKHLSYKKITVTADPNARGFYERLGFRLSGFVDSKPKGRKLPVLELERSSLNLSG